MTWNIEGGILLFSRIATNAEGLKLRSILDVGNVGEMNQPLLDSDHAYLIYYNSVLTYIKAGS